MRLGGSTDWLIGLLSETLSLLICTAYCSIEAAACQ